MCSSILITKHDIKGQDENKINKIIKAWMLEA